MNQLSDGDRSPTCTQNVDKQETNTGRETNHELAHFTKSNPEWVNAKTRGRWAEYFDPSSGTYKPPSTDARKKARRQKYAWSALTMRGGPEFVPLHLCMSGHELLAELRVWDRIGDGTSFRLPRTEEGRELVALLPLGRLRLVESLVLALLAYAMLVRKRHGLVATLAELGHAAGLRETAMGSAMTRLIALGWVRADATYTRYGACESQRGNLWRLTDLALRDWRLETPEGIAFPPGTVDRARLQRRRTYSVGSRACTTPRNPDANRDPVCTPVQNPDSFRNGARPARSEIDRPALESPAVPLPETRQGETRSEVGRLRTAMVASKLTGELVPAEVAARTERSRKHTPAAVTARQEAVFEARRNEELLALARIPRREADAQAFAESIARLVTDPVARAAIMAATPAIASGQRPPPLDDTEQRFALLELDDEPRVPPTARDYFDRLVDDDDTKGGAK